MTSKNTSWLNYLDCTRSRNFTADELKTEGLEKIMNINEITNNAFNHSIPWIYLLDYTTGKYLIVSNSMRLMLGYDPELFVDEGVDLVLDKYQPEHMRLFNEEIFPDRLNFLKKLPPEQHPYYVFSYNFQFKTNSGAFVNLLQRNCFVKSDAQGNPLLSFGVISNINHYKTENPVIQLVERIDNTGFVGGGTIVQKNTYYLHKENAAFSRREKELLLHMADGLTSKEIAQKLYISEYTVINHRRNMMDKSNSRNVAGLVAFALRNSII